MSDRAVEERKVNKRKSKVALPTYHPRRLDAEEIQKIRYKIKARNQDRGRCRFPLVTVGES